MCLQCFQLGFSDTRQAQQSMNTNKLCDQQKASIRRQFQQINYIQEELMDYNQKEHYLDCNKQGHDNKRIEFICIYSECGENRYCCNTCIQQHRHDPIALSLKYLIEYDVIKKLFIKENFYASYFKITEEMINSVIDQQIITISISNDIVNLVWKNRHSRLDGMYKKKVKQIEQIAMKYKLVIFQIQETNISLK